ncbi:hypothetical protein [Corynebacterium pacaense]|uniref:hypothetical protein n=1 Tax=Corynebacterium pacaense TaxID=1816684 RepID=UPI0015C42FDB|nr:hypothetical protein [Corynebacterium pacaense]
MKELLRPWSAEQPSRRRILAFSLNSLPRSQALWQARQLIKDSAMLTRATQGSPTYMFD